MADEEEDLLDDVAGDVSFGVEEINELLGELVEAQGERRRRDADIVAARLGIHGQRPQTFARIGARFDLARDRVRQVHTRTVGQLVREAATTGHRAGKVFAERYPLDARDGQLTRALLAETYAGDADLAATELSYLKLRLAGHDPEDSKRIAGYVAQRIMAWQKKTRHQLAKLRAARGDSALDALLSRVVWPAAGTVAPLPSASVTDIAGDVRFYLDKVGREVAFESAMEARLFQALTADEGIATFRERPCAVEYESDGVRQVVHPCVVAELTDGRAVLIDVQPLGQIGFHVRRAAAAAARAHAHANGWGLLIWTGSHLGVEELSERAVDSETEQRLRDRLASGPVFWSATRTLATELEFDLLDLLAMVLRNDWRWERAPFVLRATKPPAE
ncbi:sigma-70 family RNA polymerase sigma factor [Nocardia bovistercoris]|uniref:RNA polymerase sigma-70 region 4 domain-containing protein n=1 Tax=Nocardia bovistercoris TaxID=2785916 RepID=A0A931N0J7_9NOCA|nr:hypothetical protein [Nocardia bovistercoris]MBH0775069.1 hypothetical protein [Nocardia bovistercoris]